jgi:hypothetical protein
MAWMRRQWRAWWGWVAGRRERGGRRLVIGRGRVDVCVCVCGWQMGVGFEGGEMRCGLVQRTGKEKDGCGGGGYVCWS